MEYIIRNNQSLIQQLADRHPILFAPYLYATGKFSSRDEEPIKAKSIFSNAEYYFDDGIHGASLKHIDHFPILEIYTNDAAKKSEAQIKLTAKYLMRFYLQYIQFLPVAARIKSRKFNIDAKEFTNDEIKRRQLDTSYIDDELHYILKEYNAYVANYNHTAPLYLKINYFTLDDLKGLIALCDVYKGIGCSAAVTTEVDQAGNEVHCLIRNLDWLSLQCLGNHTLGFITRTPHTDPKRPRAVFSLGFSIGILGLSLVNDKGLVIAINEATKMDTKRENPKANCIPQFILIRQIAENCTTIAEVKRYLDAHEPATSHILTVMDREGSSGVFEILPNKGDFANHLYRFRGLDKSVHKTNQKNKMVPTYSYLRSQHVANHFLDKKLLPILGSEGFACSFNRYFNMQNAIDRGAPPIKIAQSTSGHDSVHTIIVTHENNQVVAKINWANSFSAQAVDSEKNRQLNYSTINLTDIFEKFIEKIALCSKKPLPDINHKYSVDHVLIALMKVAQRVGGYHLKLGKELTKLYSNLTLELSKNRLPQLKEITFNEHKILDIASETVYLVTKIFDVNLPLSGKFELITRYENKMQSLLTHQAIADFDLKTILQEISYGAVLGGLLAVMMCDSPSLIPYLSLNSLVMIMAGMTIGYLAELAFKKTFMDAPQLTLFSTERVSRSMRDLIREDASVAPLHNFKN